MRCPRGEALTHSAVEDGIRAGADAQEAVPALTKAAGDGNLPTAKAAVLALADLSSSASKAALTANLARELDEFCYRSSRIETTASSVTR
jgi:hypothetical protein